MSARAALPALLALAGCYSLGFEPVDTLAGERILAVPVFENSTLRRHVEHDLTRAVRRELIETTPLRLAREESGVPVLRGTIQAVQESVLIEGDQEQVLFGSLGVSVRFGVYRDGVLLVGEDTDGDGTPDQEVNVESSAEFDGTRGESRQTATDEALQDLAEMIVFRLEERADDRMEPNDEPGQAALLSAGRQAALRAQNLDWFRVVVPRRQALAVRVSSAAGGVRLSAAGPAGEPLPDAEQAPDGHAVWVLAGEEPRTVLLRVEAEDLGDFYGLDVELGLDDRLEGNDDPASARPLAPGETSARLIQRDLDWFRVEVPAETALRAVLVAGAAPAETLRLLATDPQGVPLPEGEPAADGQSVRIPSAPTARTVLIRVAGDGEGRDYRLRLEPD